MWYAISEVPLRLSARNRKRRVYQLNLLVTNHVWAIDLGPLLTALQDPADFDDDGNKKARVPSWRDVYMFDSNTEAILASTIPNGFDTSNQE